jgi:hypothetical protein
MYKLQAVEMKFLRVLVGKTRRERIRNTYIRGELKVEGITEPIQEKHAEMVRIRYKNG